MAHLGTAQNNQALIDLTSKKGLWTEL